MNEELEIFKKKLLYRASYRGTKEMDILLTAFVKKHIEDFDLDNLNELENFLKFDDEIILNFYNHNKIERDIDKNPISKIPFGTLNFDSSLAQIILSIGDAPIPPYSLGQ